MTSKKWRLFWRGGQKIIILNRKRHLSSIKSRFLWLRYRHTDTIPFPYRMLPWSENPVTRTFWVIDFNVLVRLLWSDRQHRARDDFSKKTACKALYLVFWIKLGNNIPDNTKNQSAPLPKPASVNYFDNPLGDFRSKLAQGVPLSFGSLSLLRCSIADAL